MTGRGFDPFAAAVWIVFGSAFAALASLASASGVAAGTSTATMAVDAAVWAAICVMAYGLTAVFPAKKKEKKEKKGAPGGPDPDAPTWGRSTPR